MQKYIANFVGVKKVIYAYNLEQAFQEANIFANKHKLEKHTITDCDEFIDNPPYFGIYNMITMEKVQLPVRIEKDDLNELRELAKAENRSLSNYVDTVLKTQIALEKQKRDGKK